MQRQRLENPTANLSDLFAQIARSLPGSTVSSKDEGEIFSLRQQSFQINYTIQYCFQEKKIETLVISQEWQEENCFERITIQDEYHDLKDWIVEEVLGYLSSIDEESRACIERIKGVETPRGVQAYKDGFAIDLAGMFYDLRKSKLEYNTDKISRGLQTLGALRMPTHVDWRTHSGEARMKRLFDHMLYDEDVEKELNQKLGRVDSKICNEFLRSGKLCADKALAFTEQDSISKWQDMTFELVWLCRYYAGMDMPKGLHDYKSNG